CSCVFIHYLVDNLDFYSFPTRRSSDLGDKANWQYPAELPESLAVSLTKMPLIPAGAPNTLDRSISVFAVVLLASPSQLVEVRGVVRKTGLPKAVLSSPSNLSESDALPVDFR